MIDVALRNRDTETSVCILNYRRKGRTMQDGIIHGAVILIALDALLGLVCG
jgi:acyl-coenzyme A thioesterase PaaI-like protein